MLALWVAGTLLSIALNLFVLQVGSWPSFKARAFDRASIIAAVRSSVFVWIGALCLVAGSYLDRFVLATYLTLSDVGVATFYTSFSTSVLTLVTSSSLVVASPQLIRLAGGQRWAELHHDLRKLGRTVALLGLALCTSVTVLLPLIGRLLGKAELSEFSLALALIMAATWIRLNAETAFYGLYALHADRPIWVGNLLFLVPSLLLSLLLIPHLGLVGLGLSTLASSLFLFWYRARALSKAFLHIQSRG